MADPRLDPAILLTQLLPRGGALTLSRRMSAPIESNASRWKCVCAYDGTTFAGWQSQAVTSAPGGVPRRAIQDVIEARLAEILKKPVRIHGSGRTDAGVHAQAQVFHFDAVWT